MNIISLDNQINTLITSVREAKDISSNELLKTQVVFQLTKINYGLKLVERMLHLSEVQAKVEMKLFTDENINNMSVRELIVTNSLLTGRVNDYFSKISGILGSLKLNELEGSLMMINEYDNRARLSNSNDESNSDMKNLSLSLLKTISNLQNKQAEVEVMSELELAVTDNELIDANRIIDSIDDYVDNPT